MNSIHVVALVSWREGCLLVVRKGDHPTWFQPGGKPEVGESLGAALRRELLEELNVELGELNHLGVFRTLAANEPNTELVADMFEAVVLGTPKVSQEIVDYRWMSVDELNDERIAPLIRDFVLPAFDPLRHDSPQIAN